MIDLSTCTPGQKVRYRDGTTGTVKERTLRRSFPYRTKHDQLGFVLYHAKEGKLTYFFSSQHDVVEILPVEAPAEQPMIDLSTCVPGQKVKYRNGEAGTFVGPNGGGEGSFPFLTEANYSDTTFSHTENGEYNWTGYRHPYDIVEILPVEVPEEKPPIDLSDEIDEQPMKTPQEMDYKSAYLQIANIISVAFPECEVTTVDMARLLVNENRTLRLALGLPTYEEVEDLTYTEVYE